jgi:hypothetical protein
MRQARKFSRAIDYFKMFVFHFFFSSSSCAPSLDCLVYVRGKYIHIVCLCRTIKAGKLLLPSPLSCLLLFFHDFPFGYIKSLLCLSLCAAVIENVLETSTKTHSINFYYRAEDFRVLCHINLCIKTNSTRIPPDSFRSMWVRCAKKLPSQSDFVVSSSGSTQNVFLFFGWLRCRFLYASRLPPFVLLWCSVFGRYK